MLDFASQRPAMLTESEIVGWCHALFRQKKRGGRQYRDAAMERTMAEFARAIARQRYWSDAADRDAWERSCDPPTTQSS